MAIRATFRRRGGDPVAAEYGPTPGWRPLPNTLAPWQQIGVYGNAIQSNFPSNYVQPQLLQGVEGLRSAYYTPTKSGQVNFLLNQQQAYLPGYQRYGSQYSGPLGPISSKQLQQNVVTAQIRQSGLQALQWAQGLSS